MNRGSLCLGKGVWRPGEIGSHVQTSVSPGLPCFEPVTRFHASVPCCCTKHPHPPLPRVWLDGQLGGSGEGQGQLSGYWLPLSGLGFHWRSWAPPSPGQSHRHLPALGSSPCSLPTSLQPCPCQDMLPPSLFPSCDLRPVSPPGAFPLPGPSPRQLGWEGLPLGFPAGAGQRAALSGPPGPLRPSPSYWFSLLSGQKHRDGFPLLRTWSCPTPL